MRISDWSSDVCSSDLVERGRQEVEAIAREMLGGLGLELLQFRDDPAIGVRQLDRLCVIDAAVLAFAAHQYVARCIPDIVAEIAIAGEIGRASCRERVCKYG